jgi:hypothetical protein
MWQATQLLTLGRQREHLDMESTGVLSASHAVLYGNRPAVQRQFPGLNQYSPQVGGSAGVVGSRYTAAVRRALKMRAGLTRLAEAWAYACDQQCDIWQFAVASRALIELGLTRTDLRWLRSKGYVQHGLEVTKPSDPRRRFRRGANMAFDGATCFVLTGDGVSFAVNVVDEYLGFALRASRGVNREISLPPKCKPHWDVANRVLMVDRYVIKRFKRISPNQEMVLSVFEEEGWPMRIDDPLSPKDDIEPKSRLHDTIKHLNRRHRFELIRFFGDGTGEGVCWEFSAADA